MKIAERDKILLRAFLRRESEDFKFSLESSREEYLVRMESLIDAGLSNLPAKGNYIHIESLTNMGLMVRCLTLSASEYDYTLDARCLLRLLPNSPAPVNGVGVYSEEHGI
jgi:hypothetical protein